MDEVKPKKTKEQIAMENYEKQLQRCKDYYRRNHPEPKPVGRPKKSKEVEVNTILS